MFDLKPDMAIDHSEFLSADLETEGLTGSVKQDASQEEGHLDFDSPVETAPPESEEELVDASLAFGEELLDVLDTAESPAAEEDLNAEELVSDEDSLDWGNFGEELEKELADSKKEDATGAPAEADDFKTDEGPVAVLGDSEASISSVDKENLDENELTADLGDILLADPEEVVEDNTGFDVEITEPPAALKEKITETVDAVETIEDTVEEAIDNNFATLTVPEVAAPLSGDDDKKANVGDEGSSDDSGTAEVMGFADGDIPEVGHKTAEEPEGITGADSDEAVVEDEPYGIDKEQCWQCGKKDSVGEPFVAIDGRLYCTDCLPADESENESGAGAENIAAAGVAGAAAAVGSGLAGEESAGEKQQEDVVLPERKKDFTVGGVISESWEKVKGVKGSVWAGSAIMYLVLVVIVAVGTFLLPEIAVDSEEVGLADYLLPALFQIVTDVVFMLFIAGLLFMGIRRVTGDEVNWKMIFHGFSFTGKIIVMTLLQFILVSAGFLLLILPGIYLAVGYAMAIPLIVDKNLSPWQALETSRKAVHKVWWKVAALYIVMSLIFIVALIPLGIGLIWVWPMIMVAAGVVYCRLFGK